MIVLVIPGCFENAKPEINLQPTCPMPHPWPLLLSDICHSEAHPRGIRFWIARIRSGKSEKCREKVSWIRLRGNQIEKHASLTAMQYWICNATKHISVSSPSMFINAIHRNSQDNARWCFLCARDLDPQQKSQICDLKLSKVLVRRYLHSFAARHVL